MNVLIIDALAANEGRRKFTRDAIGVGPRQLAGVCEKNSVKCKITRVEDILEDKSTIALNNFDIFLVSAMSVDLIATTRIIKKIRNNTTSKTIILGGPILSDPTILRNLGADIGVYGEGEYILQDLISRGFETKNYGENSEYYSISKTHDKSIISAKINPTDIFDTFTPSTERITDYKDYWYSRVYVEVVRGCSNHYRGKIVQQKGGCSDCGNCDTPDTVTYGECPENIPPGCGFCSVSETFGAPRSRSVQKVSEEIRQLFDNGVKRIMLSAPGFLDYFRTKNGKPTYSPTLPPANLEKIEELLSRLAEIRDEYEIKRSIAVENVKPSLVSEDVAQIMKKYIPNTPISIGCETFDYTLSDKLGRPTYPEQAIKAAKLLKKAGLRPQIYLIHSLPGESIQALNTTIKAVKEKIENFADKVTVYKYLPLPNAPFSKLDVEEASERHLFRLKREELKAAIIDFNRKKKKELIGTQWHVIVAEKDAKRKDTYISYPILGGPAISIISKRDIVGENFKVSIHRIISDKLVEGKI